MVNKNDKSKWGATVKYFNENDKVKPRNISSAMAFTTDQTFWT